MLAVLRFVFSASRRDSLDRDGARAERREVTPAARSTDLSDADLLTRLRTGSDAVARAAFSEIFLRYTPRMYASLLHGVCSDDSALAEDAVQSVMSRVWERRVELPEIDHVQSYLIQAAAREGLAVKRSRQRAVAREHSVAQSAEVDADAIERWLVEDELRLALRDAIDALPGRTGVLFRAWYASGATYESVAARFGVSTQAVVQARLRAIVQLRANPGLAPFLRDFKI